MDAVYTEAVRRGGCIRAGRDTFLRARRKKIGLLCMLSDETENIFGQSRNNQKNCGKLKIARKSVLCFNVRMTKSANVLVRKIVKATKV